MSVRPTVSDSEEWCIVHGGSEICRVQIIPSAGLVIAGTRAAQSPWPRRWFPYPVIGRSPIVWGIVGHVMWVKPRESASPAGVKFAEAFPNRKYIDNCMNTDHVGRWGGRSISASSNALLFP